MGHSPGSCERILLGSRSSPPVASSVFQLVSEPIISLVILNRLYDSKAIWRKALSSL
jgi:hypothetical protein